MTPQTFPEGELLSIPGAKNKRSGITAWWHSGYLFTIGDDGVNCFDIANPRAPRKVWTQLGTEVIKAPAIVAIGGTGLMFSAGTKTGGQSTSWIQDIGDPTRSWRTVRKLDKPSGRSGDGEIVVRVVSQANTDGWAEAGGDDPRERGPGIQARLRGAHPR